MVVGQYLTQNPTDSKELFEMLHEIKIQMGINHKVLVADNGYMDDNIIKYTYDNNIRLIIPDRNESSKNKSKNRQKPYHKVNFTYNWKTDSFTCPMGEQLHYKNNRKLNGELMRVYSTNKCKNCPVKKSMHKKQSKRNFRTRKRLKMEK